MSSLEIRQYADHDALKTTLSASLVTGWLLLIAALWILSRESAVALIAGSIGVAAVVFLVRQPVSMVYVLIALGPFYDITRGFFFPGVELLGFWQDALVAILWIVAAVNVWRRGLPKFIWLDAFVAGFVLTYAFSVVVSSDSRVWFYGFRWFVLYPLMYLALRTLQFTAAQQRRILWLLAGSLIASAIIGLLGMWYLGWDAAAELYKAMNMEIFSRNDQWRWAATFSNPIITSSAFALLFLVFLSAAYLRKRRAWSIVGCIFSVICLYLTHSRTGVVVSAVGTVVILFAVRSRYARLLLAVALAGTLVMAVRIVGSFDEWDQLRLQQFSRVMTEAVTDYPLGTGAGTAGSVSMAAAQFAGKDPSSVDYVVGDSVILTVLRDTGWMGAFCFVSAGIAVIVQARRARQTMVGLVALAFWAGSFANLMNSTDVYPTRFYLWLFAYLAVANSGPPTDLPSHIRSPRVAL